MAWDNAVVTNAGIGLLQQVLEGKTLILDYAAGGSGTVNAASLITQTALKNKKQDFTIVGSTNVSNGKRINVQISNRGLTNSYPMQQLGIWAHIGTAGPVLFAILQDDAGAAIPAEASLPEFSMNFYAVVDFSNAASFKVVIDPATLVTLGEMTEYVDNALQAKVDKIPGKGLSTNDYSNAEKEKVAQIDNKVEKVTGKGLSTNDYTAAEKAKVASIDNKVDKVSGKGLSTNDFDNTAKEQLESNNTALKNGTAIPFVTLTSTNGYTFVGNMPGVPFVVGMLIVASSENTTSLTEGRTISIKINDTKGDLIRVPDTGQLGENYQFGAGMGIFVQGPQLLQLVRDETSYFGNLKWRLVSHPLINLSDKNATNGILPITHGGMGTDWSWVSNGDKGLVSINKTSTNVLEYTYTPKSSYTNSFLTQGSNGDPTWSRPSDAASILLGGVESGSWTPSVTDGRTGESLQFSASNCRYRILGKLMMFTFEIKIVTVTGNYTDFMYISGLPAAPLDGTAPAGLYWNNLSPNICYLGVRVEPGGMHFWRTITPSKTNATPLMSSELAGGMSTGTTLKGTVLTEIS